jgi:hypothetical protein
MFSSSGPYYGWDYACDFPIDIFDEGPGGGVEPGRGTCRISEQFIDGRAVSEGAWLRKRGKV